MIYKLSEFGEFPPEAIPSGTVEICSFQEWRKRNEGGGLWHGIESILQNSRYSRVEDSVGSFFGVLCIPHRGNAKAHRLGFWLTTESLTIIDDGTYAKECCDRLIELKYFSHGTEAAFLFDFMWFITAEDDKYLESRQNALYRLEEDVLAGKSEKINEHIMKSRREFFTLRSFYEQLGMVSERLEENANGILSEGDCRLFRLFSGRCGHLLADTQMLLEYSVQIRELYQSQLEIYEAQLDLNQNRIMKVLTIVATVFMPLSLVATWYGMNFRYMPELNWPWSYPVVVGICAVIVAVNLYLFKKLGFFK